MKVLHWAIPSERYKNSNPFKTLLGALSSVNITAPISAQTSKTKPIVPRANEWDAATRCYLTPWEHLMGTLTPRRSLPLLLAAGIRQVEKEETWHTLGLFRRGLSLKKRWEFRATSEIWSIEEELWLRMSGHGFLELAQSEIVDLGCCDVTPEM